jgi:hypothetical protein
VPHEIPQKLVPLARIVSDDRGWHSDLIDAKPAKFSIGWRRRAKKPSGTAAGKYVREDRQIALVEILGFERKRWLFDYGSLSV